MMSAYMDVIKNPYVRQKAEAFYARKMEQKENTVPLPADNPSAVLIQTLCARSPDRYLMIDFWGMNCGPCRYAIQQSKKLRVEIGKRGDVKLVFIAEEHIAGGNDGYKKYVSEWLADEETICMTKPTSSVCKSCSSLTASPTTKPSHHMVAVFATTSASTATAILLKNCKS